MLPIRTPNGIPLNGFEEVFKKIKELKIHNPSYFNKINDNREFYKELGFPEELIELVSPTFSGYA